MTRHNHILSGKALRCIWASDLKKLYFLYMIALHKNMLINIFSLFDYIFSWGVYSCFSMYYYIFRAWHFMNVFYHTTYIHILIALFMFLSSNYYMLTAGLLHRLAFAQCGFRRKKNNVHNIHTIVGVTQWNDACP